MMKSLKIILWEEEVGRLAWDERRHLSYFTYNPDFIRKGLNISPLVAPVDGTRGLLPVWGEEAKIYQKLPAFVADSLPDAWGNPSAESDYCDKQRNRRDTKRSNCSFGRI